MERAIKLPRIIGITGRKFNGKDTSAEYLVKKYGYTQLAYAKPLKDICKILFGFSDEQLYGSQKEVIDEQWGTTPRKILQFIGTDLLREQISKVLPNIKDKFWIKCLEKQIRKVLADPNARVVISDVRFPNEIESIRESGFANMILRVSRPGINNTKDVHQSEILIEKLSVDHELNNDSTKEELYLKIDVLLSSKR